MLPLISASKLQNMITEHLLEGTGSTLRIPYPLNSIPRLEPFLASNKLSYEYSPTTHSFYPENTVILSITK